MDTLSKLMHQSNNRIFLNLKCAKCSVNGKFKTGLTVKVPLLKSDGTARVKILGIIKDDPACIKCGTTFPEGYRQVKDDIIYRIRPTKTKYDRLD
jgi:hypothetical protein|tara:strand:- start:632 stop:916 length:285 start_codon:yes stop_codon:yes gene_type:complete